MEIPVCTFLRPQESVLAPNSILRRRIDAWSCSNGFYLILSSAKLYVCFTCFCTTRLYSLSEYSGQIHRSMLDFMCFRYDWGLIITVSEVSLRQWKKPPRSIDNKTVDTLKKRNGKDRMREISQKYEKNRFYRSKIDQGKKPFSPRKCAGVRGTSFDTQNKVNKRAITYWGRAGKRAHRWKGSLYISLIFLPAKIFRDSNPFIFLLQNSAPFPAGRPLFSARPQYVTALI